MCVSDDDLRVIKNKLKAPGFGDYEDVVEWVGENGIELINEVLAHRATGMARTACSAGLSVAGPEAVDGGTKCKTIVYPCDLLKKGGNWLGKVRSWIQWNCNNGSTVTWSSTETLKPYLTVKQVEEIGAVAVAAYINSLH